MKITSSTPKEKEIRNIQKSVLSTSTYLVLNSEFTLYSYDVKINFLGDFTCQDNTKTEDE